MHKLGRVFFFKTNPELRTTVFLNPKAIVSRVEQALDLALLRETRQTLGTLVFFFFLTIKKKERCLIKFYLLLISYRGEIRRNSKDLTTHARAI